MGKSKKIEENIEKYEILKCIDILFKVIGNRFFANFRTAELNGSVFEISLFPGENNVGKDKRAVIYHYANGMFIDFIRIWFYNPSGEEGLYISYVKLKKKPNTWTMNTKKMDWVWLKCQMKMLAVEFI